MIGSVTINHRHDAAGNTTLTYMTLDNGSFSVNDLFTVYPYNALNQLVTQTPDAYFSGEAPVNYTYTPDGHIAKK